MDSDSKTLQRILEQFAEERGYYKVIRGDDGSRSYPLVEEVFVDPGTKIAATRTRRELDLSFALKVMREEGELPNWVR